MIVMFIDVRDRQVINALDDALAFRIRAASVGESPICSVDVEFVSGWIGGRNVGPVLDVRAISSTAVPSFQFPRVLGVLISEVAIRDKFTLARRREGGQVPVNRHDTRAVVVG